MGVWIETSVQSAPDVGSTVTPFVGVWIETCILPSVTFVVVVTPFVGVWIETLVRFWTNKKLKSHTLRGCVD